MIENDEDSPPHFGHGPGEVPEHWHRVASCNIGNLPEEKNGAKNEKLCRSIANYHLDALCLQEPGIDWRQTPYGDSFQDRLNECFERGQTCSYMSHNRHDLTGSVRQWGGTGIMSQGKLKHYACGAGSDKLELGRWTWARCRGKAGAFYRIVSVYQPNRNKKDVGSVWKQQKQALQALNDDREPREAFREDLQKELQEWIDAGDELVVAGDVNESVFHESITSIFETHHMTNPIFEMHDREAAPKTYFRSSEGRIVDGIWVTPGIRVQRCGCLEPGDFPGDHSLLWVDITFESALGHDPPLPSIITARRLRLQDSKVVKKYLDEHDRVIRQLKLVQRQKALMQTVTHGVPLNPQQRHEADAIDALKTRAMRHADKKCRKLKMGGVQFSMATNGPMKRIDFWEIAIRRRRKCTVSPKLWDRRKKAAGITARIRDITLDDMLVELKQARKECRKAKRDHQNLRNSCLDTLEPKDRDRIKRSEESRRKGRLARKINGKLEDSRVTQVQDEHDQMQTEKLAIDRTFLRVNRGKMHSSEHTSFFREPLKSIFGARGKTPAADQVTNGTFAPPHGTDQCATSLIEGLKRPEINSGNRPPFVPRTRIATDDHIRAWKKAKEKTAGGKSGLHFGMFKAHIKRRHLAELDASVRDLAYQTGFAHSRWKWGLDFQLMKKKLDYRASKQRTIKLVEPCFNTNNKALGADIMRAGERHGTLARDNYGGRKGYMASEVSMNECLMYDSVRARRGRVAVASSDLMGCYDRLVHVIVRLAMRRQRVPDPPIDSMIETIQEMVNYIVTALGLSEETYGNEPGKPCQTIMQGNGAGPAAWLAIFDAVIYCMKKAGFGWKEVTLVQQKAFEICCFAIVDDTDLIHSNPNVSTDQLIQETQEALSTWEGLIGATGGQLHPEKGYWYLVEVVRKKGKWNYARKSQRPGDLFIREGTVLVERLEAYQAREALGIMIRPDGKMTDELKMLAKKIQRWCDALRTKKILPSDAWYCLLSTIMKTLEYPLVATSFTRQQVDKLMAPLLQVVLNKCSIQKHIPHKLLYGTLKERGFALKDIYLLQLIFHLQAIMRHEHRDTPSRDLFHENMELVQRYVGSRCPFWDLPYEWYGCLAPKGWMQHTWKCVDETSAVMKGPSITLPPRRRHEIFLSDAFAEMGYDEEDKVTLRDCRMHMGVTMLSDICTADGAYITKRAWEGKPPLNVRKEIGVKTCCLYKPAWDLWRTALRNCFLFPHATHLRLRRRLGPWLKRRDDHWIWWRYATTNCLYEQRAPDTWYRWACATSHRGKKKFHAPQPVLSSDVPYVVTRACITIARNSSFVALVSTGDHNEAPTPPTPTSLTARIAALPMEARWALQHVSVSDNGRAIARAIEQGRAVMAGDGSLKFGLGTAAFVIEGVDSNNRITAVNRTPGPIKEGDSHRCEMSGMYGGVLLLKLICDVNKVRSGKVKIACDNETAIGTFDYDFIPHTKHSSFDLVSATHSMLKECPFEWEGVHVKGHQDKHKSYQALSRLSKLNVQMDTMAKAYWQHLVTNYQEDSIPVPVSHPIYKEGWQLWVGDVKIVEPSTNKLYSLIQDPITRSWWVRHNHATWESKNMIDAKATEDMMFSLPQPRRRWVSKQSSENCGVGTTMLEWGFWENANCPRCPCPQETTEHVQQCMGHGSQETFESSITNVGKHLTKAKTCPILQESLIKCLRQFRMNQPIDPNDFPPSVRLAIYEQNRIGWLDLLEGCASKQWQLIQKHYYKDKDMKKSSKLWIKGLLIQLHHLAWKQWDHRNKINQRVTKPQAARAMQMLDEDVTEILTSQMHEMSTGDKRRLNRNLLDLLGKPVAYKKRWLCHARIARQRHLRKVRHDDDLVDDSARTSQLCQFFARKVI